MYQRAIGIMVLLTCIVAGSANAWYIADANNGSDSNSGSGTGYNWHYSRNTSGTEAYAKTWDATYEMETCDTSIGTGVQWVKKYVTGSPPPCPNDTVHYVATAQVWGKVTGNANNGGWGEGNCSTDCSSDAIVNAPGYSHTVRLEMDGSAHESTGWSVGVTITGAGGSASYSGTGASYNKEQSATLDKEDNASAVNAFVTLTMSSFAHSWFDNGADGPHVAHSKATVVALEMSAN